MGGSSRTGRGEVGGRKCLMYNKNVKSKDGRDRVNLQFLSFSSSVLGRNAGRSRRGWFLVSGFLGPKKTNLERFRGRGRSQSTNCSKEKKKA